MYPSTKRRFGMWHPEDPSPSLKVPDTTLYLSTQTSSLEVEMALRAPELCVVAPLFPE